MQISRPKDGQPDTSPASTAWGSGLKAGLTRAWRHLTDAPSAVTDAERARQIRLLTGLLLLLIPLGIAAIGIQLALVPGFGPTFVVVAIAIAFLVAAYGLARTGHYRSGAVLAVGVTAVGCFAAVILRPHVELGYAYLFLSIFLASLLFNKTGAAITTLLLLLVVTLVLPALGIDPPANEPAAVPIFLIIVSALLLLHRWHRNLLEHERHAELAASEERFRSLAEVSFEGIVVAVDGRIIDMNERGAAILGAPRGAIIGRSVLDFCAPEFSETVLQHIRSGSEEPYEIIGQRADGTRFPMELHGRQTTYLGRPVRVTVFRDLTEHRRAEEDLLQIARGVSASIGESFFHSLVAHLAKTLDADYAFVGELIPGSSDRIRTIAVNAKSQPVANFEYPLAGTPCENVVGRQSCSYQRGVQAQFPTDHMLVEMGIEAYVGTPLFDSSRQALGLITVLFRRPVEQYERIASTLQIFATRAAAELERVHAEQALSLSEGNFRALTENANVGIMVNYQGKHVFANSRMSQMLGYTLEEFRTTGVKDLVHPSEYDKIMNRFRERMQGKPATPVYETVFLTKQGQEVPVEISAAKTTWQGEPAGLVFLLDISERRRTEAQMHKLSSAIEQAADAVTITDRNGVIEYVNPAFAHMTGYTQAEVIGQKPRLVKSGKQGAAFYDKLWQTILAGQVFSEVFINRHKNGSLYYEEKTITPLKDSDGRVTHFVATGKDVTERMQTQERLQYMAEHDALTELPNRVLLLDRLKQALARARWHERIVALLFVDLDRFKTINDTLGHETGDLLLQQLATRFSNSVRAGDTVARFGGDEFVILLDDVASENDIRSIALKVLGALTPAFEIDDQRLYITASIGISLYPNDGEDSSTLLKHADIAMYRAKELGKNTYQFYSADMSARAFERLTLESSLRHALERSELRLHYQPVFDVASGGIVGVEALLRWQHPDFGLVLPNDFIPLLEETGLIVPAGEWVLDTACAQLRAWHLAGWPQLRMAINLSPRQFQAEGELTSTLERNLKALGCNPHLVELEITEGLLLQHATGTLAMLDRMQTMGVRLAIDDFGTGYSSLSYLRRFPIDTLKIDRSFVHDIPGDEDDSAITAAIIVLAQSLKLDVIAEGVETEAQRDFLRARGCHLMQGLLFSRPLPAEEITPLLEAQTQRLEQDKQKLN